MKKASQVLYLHFALKKRAFIEDIHEKQEQVCLFDELHFYNSLFTESQYTLITYVKVKEWLQSLGIGERTAVVHNEPLEEVVPSYQTESQKNM